MVDQSLGGSRRADQCFWGLGMWMAEENRGALGEWRKIGGIQKTLQRMCRRLLQSIQLEGYPLNQQHLVFCRSFDLFARFTTLCLTKL